ncbi:AAA family ATPase [Hymenobacter sp. CRA2]|uniref:AAA family ATPase n=1 Tax=Hymenobacter sp. CRA2 TaxID=1955620 RepID=UPI00098F510D|nr:AAA family ATPase [Hymenobacter sp. CRA2]OON65285.1 hypothetical protein B0919_24280 [Hymenobacter sp. CRA2]
MNEQLIVKNFGPIKDATVDFKKVTVFIGPTGGGKSTLAKLAAICRDVKPLGEPNANISTLKQFNLNSHRNSESVFKWVFGDYAFYVEDADLKFNDSLSAAMRDYGQKFIDDLLTTISIKDFNDVKSDKHKQIIANLVKDVATRASIDAMDQLVIKSIPHYIPSERIFVPAVEYSWAGLMRDDIGLPKLLLDFANNFSLSRKEIPELSIPFLDVTYLHIDGKDFIKIPHRTELLMLLETASGIQSATPLMVLLEKLSRNTSSPQSFIVEELELNLYPTAQQGLLNWLVEKCTKAENDLTLTTHSPYILSHLNLLLYAYQVAKNHPERKAEVAAIVPEASWINPKEFACYQVENGGVQSLVNEELGLIDNNELDALSGDAADAFDNLVRLSKSVSVK